MRTHLESTEAVSYIWERVSASCISCSGWRSHRTGVGSSSIVVPCLTVIARIRRVKSLWGRLDPVGTLGIVSHRSIIILLRVEIMRLGVSVKLSGGLPIEAQSVIPTGIGTRRAVQGVIKHFIVLSCHGDYARTLKAMIENVGALLCQQGMQGAGEARCRSLNPQLQALELVQLDGTAQPCVRCLSNCSYLA